MATAAGRRASMVTKGRYSTVKQLGITGTITRKDGQPLEPHRVAHIIDGLTRVIENHGCEWLVLTGDEQAITDAIERMEAME